MLSYFWVLGLFPAVVYLSISISKLSCHQKMNKDKQYIICGFCYILLSVSVCGSPRLMGTLKPLGSSDWSSSTSSSLESSGGGGTEFD